MLLELLLYVTILSNGTFSDNFWWCWNNKLKENLLCVKFVHKLWWDLTASKVHVDLILHRGVASLTVQFNFPHFSSNFHQFFLFFLKFPSILFIFPQISINSFIFPQTFHIFVLRAGGSPTREGPGYTTDSAHFMCLHKILNGCLKRHWTSVAPITLYLTL